MNPLLTIAKTAVAATALAIASQAIAQVNINISIAPPVPIYESAPTIAPGYVWAPGYWAWHNDRHVWVRGRTIVQRVGYRWEPDRWERRGDGYYRQPGNWIHATQYVPIQIEKDKKPKKWKNDKHYGNGKGGNKGQGKKHSD